MGAPLRELPGEEDEIWGLRDRIAAGRGHPHEHLGEAQSIVLARRIGAVLVTEDAGSREEARAEKVRAVSVHGLLGVHLHRGRLTQGAATTIVGEMCKAGRGPQRISLRLGDLIAAGHVVSPVPPGAGSGPRR